MIVASGGETPRGFFSEEGRQLFEELCASAPQKGYRALVDALESGELLAPETPGPQRKTQGREG